MCNDPIAVQLVQAIQAFDPNGSRIGRVFREAFDQAYHGQLTGRYSVAQLSKTEKAHIGSLVEINLRRELDGFVTDGEVMDFKILGHEVDCKYSLRQNGWMIPNEALGHYAMLCHSDDQTSKWWLGFVKITDEILNKGNNRDQKKTISKIGRNSIVWAWRGHPMPPNVLLQLSPVEVELILSETSGQTRLNNLFRMAEGMIIPRGIIATVARQKDYMKRIRGNGGSRSLLQPEGYIILGDYKRHRQIAQSLELPIPEEGDSVSVRLYPAEPDFEGPSVILENVRWRRANTSDPMVAAPTVNHKS